MKKNIVTVKGFTFKEVEQALNKWINLYEENLEEKLSFKILKKDNSNFLIVVEGEITNEMFHFLTNYIYYPFDLDKPQEVRGYTTIRDSSLFPKSELGKRVVIFIPENEKDGDNVYASTGNGTVYRIDFGGRRLEVESLIQFEEPDLKGYKPTEYRYSHTKKTISEKFNTKSKKSVSILISNYYFPLLILNIALIEQHQYFIYSLTGLSIILVFWVYFIHDDELKDTKVFLRLFGISMILAVCGYYFEQSISSNIDGLIYLTFFYSILFLVSYSIFRPTFKYLFKKEPILDRSNSTFSNVIYSLLVTMTPFFALLILISSK